MKKLLYHFYACILVCCVGWIIFMVIQLTQAAQDDYQLRQQLKKDTIYFFISKNRVHRSVGE